MFFGVGIVSCSTRLYVQMAHDECHVDIKTVVEVLVVDVRCKGDEVVDGRGRGFADDGLKFVLHRHLDLEGPCMAMFLLGSDLP